MPRLFFNPVFSPIKEDEEMPECFEPHSWTKPEGFEHHVWAPCNAKQSKKHVHWDDERLAPCTPLTMHGRPSLNKHLAEMQETRVKMQAGARHLQDLCGQAKQELHSYKDCEHHAMTRELAAVREVEAAIQMRAAILDEIRKRTRALQAAEALLKQREAQLNKAAREAASAQLHRDNLRYQAKLASAKAMECSKSARHMAKALAGAQRAEEELAAAFPLKTSPVSPAKVRHIENLWGDLWDP